MSKSIVLVDWLDSNAHHGWQDADNDFPVAMCQSAGFLIKRDKKQVTVAASWDATSDHMSDIISIPRSSVRRIRRLSVRMTPHG